MIEERFRERLVGATVLTTVVVILTPMIFQGSSKSEQAPVTQSQGGFTSNILHPSAPVEVLEVEPVLEPISTTRRPSQAPNRAPLHTIARASEPLEAETLSRRPLAEGTRAGWVVQLASFSREANAKSLRAKLIARGFAAFIEETRSVYRVRVGPTSRPRQARDLRRALKQAVNLQGMVVRYP